MAAGIRRHARLQQDFCIAAGEGAAGVGGDGSVIGGKCEGAGVQGRQVLLQRGLLLPVEYPSGAGGGEGTLEDAAVRAECCYGAAGGEVFEVFSCENAGGLGLLAQGQQEQVGSLLQAVGLVVGDVAPVCQAVAQTGLTHCGEDLRVGLSGKCQMQVAAEAREVAAKLREDLPEPVGIALRREKPGVHTRLNPAGSSAAVMPVKSASS